MTCPACGFRTRVRFLAAELANDDYILGDWDASLAGCEAFLADVEAGAAHYLEEMIRLTRASIESARGLSARVEPDLLRALDLARPSAEPQSLLPGLAVAACVAADAGDAPRAAALVDELFAVVAGDPEGPHVEMWMYPGLHAVDELGRLAEVDPFLVDAPAIPWVDAARLHVSGDLAAAANMLAGEGAIVEAARTRLTLAERLAAVGRRAEAEGPLGDALAFYRSVGAVHYVRRAERLLAASA